MQPLQAFHVAESPGQLDEALREGVIAADLVHGAMGQHLTGDDRVFPKGLPVGQVTTVRQGKSVKEIYVTPSGFQNGFEEVLVVLDGVHQAIPDAPTGNSEIKMLPAPPPDKNIVQQTPAPNTPGALNTDADRLLDRYKKIGDIQGQGYAVYGSRPPNFNINPDDPKHRKPAADPNAPKPECQADPPASAPPAQAPPQ